MSERANPFGDLDDFVPAPAKPKVDPAVIDQVAEANGFPSRQAPKESMVAPTIDTPVTVKEPLPSRRRTTGRSEQVNIKTTARTKRRLLEISVERDMPLGEVLELALKALEHSWNEK